MHGSKKSTDGRLRQHDAALAQLQGAGLPSCEIRLLIQRLEAELSRLRRAAVVPGHKGRRRRSSSHRQTASSARLPNIVEDLIAAKQSDGMSRRYLETIRSHLHRFAECFTGDIEDITTKQIEDWLRSLEVSGRTRNNVRNSVVLLFRFAQKQGYLSKGHATEADDTARAKDHGGQIGILRPDELAHVLRQARGQVRLFFVLGAFTGMRSSEILRLSWSDINSERRVITVAAEKSKTATRRLVPIHPNLSEWLRPYSEKTGLLFHGRHDAARAIAFAKACGIAWPNNALRHSYATYRLAITANAPRVALEMGNSPQKLMSNYRELADELDAQNWFAILPPP